METDFGAVQGDIHTFSALATLAHDCRRPEMFQPEYIAAINLFSKGIIDLKTTGAWAGEVGQVQMLPSDILKFGKDGDNDGFIDLKKSPEDAILTAAALISELGWEPNQPWIEEVIIDDKNFPWKEAGFGRDRKISSWKKLGIISRNKKFMASDNTKATLLLPQGLKGPKFLAYSNYNIYLKWNDSFIYTVTAAHLASRFSGQKKFLSNKPDKILSLEKMIKLQNILQSNGYNVGKVDGILGRQTRQSVRNIQIKLGLPADSWPTDDLLNILTRTLNQNNFLQKYDHQDFQEKELSLGASLILLYALFLKVMLNYTNLYKGRYGKPFVPIYYILACKQIYERNLND